MSQQDATPSLFVREAMRLAWNFADAHRKCMKGGSYKYATELLNVADAARAALQAHLEAGSAAVQAVPVDQVPLAPSRVGRVYLAGPMTGIENFNFPAFNAAAAELRASGLQVVNPAEHGLVDGAEWEDYLRFDIAKIAGCESLRLLPGWSKSRGARLEVHLAQALSMPIMLLPDAEPVPAAPLPLPVAQAPQATGKTHKLKTDPEVFEAVRRRIKNFEIRLNDRDFSVGDTLELHETAYTGAEMKAGQPLLFTGRAELREVSHVLTGYGLMDGWCCLSFATTPALPVSAAQEHIALQLAAALELALDGDTSATGVEAGRQALTLWRRYCGIAVSAQALPAQAAGEPSLPPIESTSAAVHAAWVQAKLASGVTSRRAEDGEELIAPYEQLSEKAKELDRGTVRAVYAAIQAAQARAPSEGQAGEPKR